MNLLHVTLFLVIVTVSDAGKKKKKEPASDEKCDKWIGKFDGCLANGYKPRNFKSCQEMGMILEDESVGKNKKCRRLEIKIKKRCSYTCPPIVMPGGVYEVEVTDESVTSIADIAVMELKNRAVRAGSLDEDRTIVRGEIVKAMKQVVSGERYIITMRLGITDMSECKEAAENQIVSSTDCNIEENMGTYRFQVIDAPWRTPRYDFEAMEDVEGPALTAKYWEERRPVVMPGGMYEAEVNDEGVIRVADLAVKELKNRAVSLGALDEDSSIIRGDIVKVMKQVVSGVRYIITIKLGITDMTECKEAADDQIVSSTDCNIEKNMGTYRFEVIEAPWRTPRYTFGVMEDVEGPALTAKYWEVNKQDIY